MGIEFEVKFRATDEILEKIRRQTPGKEVIFHMQTIYYDTPSNAFSQRQCTLRRRLENEKFICTLKTPAQGLGRQEWETQCSDIKEAIDQFYQLGAPSDILELAKEGLSPICGARFIRVAKLVPAGEGWAELALDCGVLEGGKKEKVFCEVEIEQKTCSQKECLALAQMFAAQYGLEREEKSKFRRAFAMYKGE